MIVEGKNSVRETLNSNSTIDKLYVQEGFHNMGEFIEVAKKRKIKYSIVPKATLDKLSPTGKHQGLLLLTSSFEYSSLDEMKKLAKSKKEDLFLLILDGIEDPHNLGSIIRTAECAGVHGIIIPKNNSVQVNDTVLRVSVGASSHMLIARVTNINYLIDELKDDFIQICAADMDGKALYNTPLKGPIAIIIGGEGDGIRHLTKKKADMIISIPQFGQINSLNASVAAAVTIYEVVRQRGLK